MDRTAATFKASLALARPSTRTAAIAFIAVGIALRLAEYLHNHSLWLDEAFIALNLQSRSFVHLFGLLDYNQAAPPGFLFLEKLMASAFGGTELALRAVPLVAGVVSVPAFYAAARRILRPWPAVLALALFAVLDPFVRYSAEMKQYSTDVLVALGLLLLALGLGPPNRLDWRRSTAAAAAGAAAVWLSYPAVFLLAGFSAVLLGEALWRRDWLRARALGIVSAVWLGSFLLLATTTLRSAKHLAGAFQPDGGGGAGESARSEFFLPFPPKSTGDVGWFPSAARSFVTGSVGFDRWAVVGFALLALAGAVALFRRGARTALLLLAALVFILAASALEKYPFGLRFTLFYGPYVLLLVAAGAGAIVSGVAGDEPGPARRRMRGIVALGVVAFLAVPLESTFNRVVHHRGLEEIKPALAALQSNWRDGDALYVYAPTQYALRYYHGCGACGVIEKDGAAASLWSSVLFARPTSEDTPALLSDLPRLLVGLRTGHATRAEILRQIDRLRGRARVWVLFTHIGSGRGAQESRDILGHLDRLGTRRAAFRPSGAALLLYDLR